MEPILNKIENCSLKLENHSFCQWISTLQKNAEIEKSFSYTPSMLFFIMGFRDILNELSYAHPQSEIEHMINTHCKEDENHWMWYLKDLKTLGYLNFFENKDLTIFIKEIWSMENKSTRDLVYSVMHLIKKYQNPIHRLVIVECLEATFGVFMNQLKKNFSQDPIYKELYFFGFIHEKSESEHTMGSWIDTANSTASHSVISPETILSSNNISNEELAIAQEIIDEVFSLFDSAFLSWNQNKDKYSRSNHSHNLN